MTIKKVCLLSGGDSGERDISKETGRALSKALTELGVEFIEIDPADGLLNLVSKLDDFKPDCVLNGLHGKGGEDGDIQGLLNLMKIPYTHSGKLASAIAMDKYIAGIIFDKHGIPIPESKLIKSSDIHNFNYFEFPFVIKPVDEGSSIGVYVIFSENDLANVKWDHGDDVLVQKYISGRELTVGIINGKAIGITEIKTNRGFYDYTAKYSNGGSEHVLSADIPCDIATKLKEYSELAYKCMRCRGVARADFRYDNEKGMLYILELNTQPGMTSLSLVPEQAAHVEISFKELVKLMVDQACYDT